MVVLTNTSSFIGAHLMALALLRSLLGVPDPAAQLPRVDVADHPHSWSELVGYYAPRPGFLTNLRAWQIFGGEVQVVIKHRQLVIRGLSGLRRLRQGLRLYATDDTDPLLFVVEFDGLVVPVAFERDVTGRVRTLAFGPPAGMVFHRRSTLRSSRVHWRLADAGGVASACRIRQLTVPPSAGSRL